MAPRRSSSVSKLPVSVSLIERRIYLIRGKKVMLSSDLAELYQVEVRVLVQAVKRDADRFPVDFMFQLNEKEYASLKSQFVISSWGGARRARPYAFTEQGVAMLSSVLRSKRAIQVNVANINRTMPIVLTGVLLFLGIGAGILTRAQETTNRLPAQTSDTNPAQRSEFIAPGIEHIQVTRGYKSDKEATGPWFINILRIDLGKARLRMVHAMDEAVGLETVSSMAARYGALAAVNSGYFRTTGTYRGDSVGIEVLGGKLLSEPNNVRVAAGLIEQEGKQQLIFGHIKFAGQLVAGAPAKHAIDGLNRPRGENELIIFTPEFHRTTLTDPNGLELIVRRERIVERRDRYGSSAIPGDGFVISVAGTARRWALKKLRVGTRVRMNLDWSPTETEQTDSWKRAASIIGGGPQLIKNGHVEITNAAEKILPSFVNDGHPRTAIAKLKSGQVLLVTVDGRQPGESIGMSLTILADLLIEFGAAEAINLDGGGSTSMVIKNKLVNKPSDATGERPVSDAILIFPRP
jgi:exopolysaccharide biosynthesis protein